MYALRLARCLAWAFAFRERSGRSALGEGGRGEADEEVVAEEAIGVRGGECA